MAVVRDLSNPAPPDKKYEGINRRVTGPVAGVVTPAYMGERIFDEATHQVYKAISLDSQGWQQLYLDH